MGSMNLSRSFQSSARGPPGIRTSGALGWPGSTAGTFAEPLKGHTPCLQRGLRVPQVDTLLPASRINSPTFTTVRFPYTYDAVAMRR